MGLTQTLSTALSGLTATQTSLSIVAANVANADSPSYVRKAVVQVPIGGSDAGIGVRISAVQRTLDQYVQRQLRVENSGAAYADLRAQFYSRLQSIFGDPGSDGTLESVYNNFTNALQALSTSPDDATARSSAVEAAQLLAQKLNDTSEAIEGLRGDCELGLADAVTKANDALSQIAKLNQQIAGAPPDDAATAAMLDQRDSYIDQLSQLMDINVVSTGGNGVAIYTRSGIQLVGNQAAQLSFDPAGTVTAVSRWSADPTQRSLGTITLVPPGGGAAIDLVQANAFRSGTIAAYLQLRDQDLVQAQNQIDNIASQLASALSDTTAAGTPVAGGFEVDIGSLQNGNTVTINYTDTATNTPHTITLVRVDDPSLLPLSDSATATPGDTVYGIDFSGGIAAAVAQINAAIAPAGLQASNSGTLLSVVDDGSGTAVVDGLSATTTATSLTGGVALPFFTDGTQPYTGAITAFGSQRVGLASRIAVNPALVADPSKLVLYQAGVAAGDSTRPDYLYQQLASGSFTFAPGDGLGSADVPFSGSIATYLRQVLSQQGEAADAANNLKQGQDVVLSNLQQRFNETAGVNIDQEMANLLNLQNSYAANARVLTTVSEMLNTLLNI
ncbi:MAG: flagellar hook-associated protein FlgK [Pseudolabrys sp.]|nr:flagellar hook-associated protein FlgK [Pseudolabrys sp.]